MGKFKFPGIGMRTVKTAVAVMICLALGQAIEGSLPLYACIAAVLSLRETVDNSVAYGITRILATLFGGAVSILVLALNVTALSPWLQIVIIGAAIILTIQLTIVFKRPDTTALAVVILLIIALTHQDDKYIYALRRIIETLTGIVVAIVVNKYFDLSRFRNKKDAPGEDAKDAEDAEE